MPFIAQDRVHLSRGASPKLAKEFDVPLLPFFMEEVYLKPQWMQDDGIHPNRDAQPFIADWMAKQLQPLVNHDS